jgi:hypothetical protein
MAIIEPAKTGDGKRPREYTPGDGEPTLKRQHREVLEPIDHVSAPIQHAHVCLTSLDEDFIIHARDQVDPGKSLEDGLVR